MDIEIVDSGERFKLGKDLEGLFQNALRLGMFEWSDDRVAYVCDQTTIDWWNSVIAAPVSAANR